MYEVPAADERGGAGYFAGYVGGRGDIEERAISLTAL